VTRTVPRALPEWLYPLLAMSGETGDNFDRTISTLRNDNTEKIIPDMCGLEPLVEREVVAKRGESCRGLCCERTTANDHGRSYWPFRESFFGKHHRLRCLRETGTLRCSRTECCRNNG
jgi:hypothetical protein